MNRRKFVSNACVLTAGVVGSSFNSINDYSSNKFNIELKNLCDESCLTKVNIGPDLQFLLDQLKPKNIISYAETAYQYDNNYIVEVKIQDMFRTRTGLLFVTSSENYLLLQDQDIEVLNDFISNFKIGIEQQDFNLNPAEFLFPYQINNNESAVFSFNNKYGNEVKLKMKGDNKHIFIS